MSVLSPSRLRARVAPHLSWAVPFEAGVYGNSPRWSNKDLDPVPYAQRTWGGLDYWAYWVWPALVLDMRAWQSARVTPEWYHLPMPIVCTTLAWC